MRLDRPITADAGAVRRATGCLGCFFVPFAVMGAGLFGAAFVPAIFNVIRASTWGETPCRILASAVLEHPGSDGSTYSVNITYEYEVGGIRHTSNSYSFEPGTSSSASGPMWDAVNAHPPGRRTVCYVNPSRPTDAVLNRGFTWRFLWGLLPLLFATIGFGALIMLRRGLPMARSGIPGENPAPGRLKSGPGWSVVVILAIIAALWNGGVWFGPMREWKPPSGGGFMTWFTGLLPLMFPVIGLFLAGMTIRMFLKRFNPRTMINVSRTAPALGETFEVEWSTSGKLHRVAGFTIRLEGVECAVRSGSKRKSTREEVFESIPVADSDKGDDLRQGRRKVLIPDTSMHSVKAGQNEIYWAVRVRVRVPLWPDGEDEFKIEVRPAPPSP